MKTCSICKKEKPKSSFYKHKLGKEGLQPSCKECDMDKGYKWKKNNPDKVKNIWLKLKYNITVEEYNSLYIQQEGCCAICKLHQSTFKKVLFVDHCHTTGRVRGLLCNSCNVMLGGAKDNTEVLKEGIKYLNKGESCE